MNHYWLPKQMVNIVTLGHEGLSEEHGIAGVWELPREN
jgi:hypothetical protein